jgi:anaerobic selenocysteine-containing dehydrogenase/Fe-S-cluster-containing dehydrogenase component
MTSSMDRRRFLKVAGVTGGGAAALAGCSTDRVEKLIPYIVPPDNQIPGIATYYATTCRECPGGCGIHARVREGRPVKVEGNPENPINRGKLCARGHASLQGLYNPDRVRQPMVRNASGGFDPVTWDDALARVAQRLSGGDGSRVWFLSGNESGTFDRLIGEWLQGLGSTNRVVYEPFGYEALREASRLVFGRDAIPSYDLAAAQFVISFGTDFLETWLSPVEFAGRFASMHGYRDEHMGRFVHVEPRMSMTAFSADEWVAPVPGTEALIALAMARVILNGGGANTPRDANRLRGLLEPFTPESVSARTGVSADAITRLATDFATGPSVALAGGTGAQHGQAHMTAAAAGILNYVNGNVGRTVMFGADLNPAGGSTYRGLTQLAGAMQDGQVGVLFMHGTNPVHTAPSGATFAEALGQVELKVSFARFLDETSELADIILPDHDPLEQWNDFEPRAGAYVLLQPTMRPLFDTRQTGDVLLTLAGQVSALTGKFTAATYKDYLQASWQQIQRRLGDRTPFDAFWIESLRAGGRHATPATPSVTLAGGVEQLSFDIWSGGRDLSLIVYPSSTLYDGRGANRPWLQELPDPVSKVTWSSWVEMHPETAARVGVADGDMVDVTTAAGSVRAPAFVYPGIRPDVVAIPTGQGHTQFGRYASEVGGNAFRLLDSEPAAFGGMSFYAGVTLAKAGPYERLATTAGSPRQLGRGLAQSTLLGTVAAGEYHEFHMEHAAEAPEQVDQAIEEWQQAQLDEWEQRGAYAGDHPRWGLAVDLSRCTGCSACITACYSENNIPTVGKAQVQRGREMTWIRVERYFEGGDEEPLRVELLPMMCQQCGRAPCEPVCPVFAAYHTPDGLNGQVYNRCVGTRYCANNCPYKVRYFNWFDHGNPGDPALSWPEPLPMLLNPDVTVRSKGVMEKCTFCVQRIRGAQHTARLERRVVSDGEIQTACQQTCPANAIVFGDLNDPASEVSTWSQSELTYRVLESLNTDPGVRYLARVRNAGEA